MDDSVLDKFLDKAVEDLDARWIASGRNLMEEDDLARLRDVLAGFFSDIIEQEES